MPTQLNQQDLDQPRREPLFGLPSFVGRWITKHMLRGREAKNLTIVFVMVNVLLTTVPLALLQFYLEGWVPLWVSCVVGVAYVAFTMRANARSFILALHYSTHSPVFTRRWNGLRHLNSSLICNFFGIPLWCYYAHHVAMHHDENNLMPHDVSSTMPYQRDSRKDHWKYLLRYICFIWFELPYHLIRKGNVSVGLRCASGALIFVSCIALLFFFRPISTLFVFIIPAFILSFALMEGNWKQHIFVDPDDPDNAYKSTYTCINTHTNALNFNDGYHVEHHLSPNVPWHALPVLFQKHLQNYAKEDGFVFSGIGSSGVGRLVLAGKLDVLADHYLNVGQVQRTKEELIEEFKRRLKPIEGFAA